VFWELKDVLRLARKAKGNHLLLCVRLPMDKRTSISLTKTLGILSPIPYSPFYVSGRHTTKLSTIAPKYVHFSCSQVTIVDELTVAQIVNCKGMAYIVMIVSNHGAGMDGVPSVFSKDYGGMEIDKSSSKSHFREARFQTLKEEELASESSCSPWQNVRCLCRHWACHLPIEQLHLVTTVCNEQLLIRHIAAFRAHDGTRG
jgi:hypothetical protein